MGCADQNWNELVKGQIQQWTFMTMARNRESAQQQAQPYLHTCSVNLMLF